MKKNEPDNLARIALGVCVSVFVIFTAILYFKYIHFGYEDWDLAFFSQSLWNLGHGQQYSSLFGKNFLGNHANFIAFLLVPIYSLFPNAFLLIIIKVLCFTVGAYLFFILARPYVGRAALLLMMAYIFYAPNIFGLLFEFDYENLALPVVFGLLYYFDKGNLKGFLILSVLLILMKENLTLIVAAFGVLGLLTKPNKLEWGIVPILMGSIAFYVLTSTVVPYFNYKRVFHEHPYIYLYKDYGKSFIDVVKSIVFHPNLVLELLRDPQRVNWLLAIFKPLCFLPLLSPAAMLLVIPLIAQHFFSINDSEHSIYFYYVMIYAPFIFWGLARVLSMYRVRSMRSYQAFLFVIGVFTVINLGQEWDFIQKGIYPKEYAAKPYMISFKAQLLKEIPAQSPVLSSFTFLPQLSARPELYGFYKLYSPKFHWGLNSKIIPKLQYACIDFFETPLFKFIDNDASFSFSQRRIHKFFQDNWSVKDALENVVLFERKQNPLRLVEVLKEPGGEAPPNLNVKVNGESTLLAVTRGVSLNHSAAILPLTFYWKAQKPSSKNYGMIIYIKDKGGRLVLANFHVIGYALYPTKAWQEGDYIKERYWLYVPHVNLDQASVAFDFWEGGSGSPRQRAVIESDKPEIVNSDRQVELKIKDL
jgi:uncharacterized membrane protein